MTTSEKSEVPIAPVAKTGQGRSHLVDVVRGIAISLVCLGHTDQGTENRGWWGTSQVGYNIDQFIYAFHMPAFFFVSGIFLTASVAKRGPLAFVRAKFGQLIYPYVVWSAIEYLLSFPLHQFIRQPIPSLSSILYALVTGGIFWFLPAVFCCYMLGMLVRNQNKVLVFAGALVLTQISIPINAAVIPTTLLHFPYLVVGMWVGQKHANLNRLPRPLAALGAIILAGSIFSVTRGPIVHNYWLMLVLGLAGTAMLFLFAACFRGGSTFARVMAWVGEASFGVYVMSSYGQGLGREMLARVAHITEPYAQLIIPTALAILIPALIYHRRYRLKIAWLFSWPSLGKA